MAERPCPACEGTGRVYWTECARCDGVGTLPSWRDRLIWWWWATRFKLIAALCRILPHDWCEWDTTDPGPWGELQEFRVCNRCTEIEHRDPLTQELTHDPEG